MDRKRSRREGRKGTRRKEKGVNGGYEREYNWRGMNKRKI